MENTAELKKRELASLNFIKTILMLSVVLYHSVLIFTSTDSNWEFLGTFEQNAVFNYIYYFFQPIHTRLFTLVSGYLFFYLKHERGKYQDGHQFVLNKANRLLLPFALCVFLFMIPIKCGVFGMDFIDVAKSALVFDSCDQYWFLAMLFLMFMLFFALDKFFYKANVASLFVVLIIFGIGFGLTYLDLGIANYQLFNVGKYILYFYGGYKMRQNTTKWMRKLPSWVLLILLVGSFIPICYMKEYCTGTVATIGTVLYGLSFIPYPFMVFVILSDLYKHIKPSKALDFLSKRSMMIYLFHQEIVYLSVLAFGKLNSFIVAPLTFVIATVGALVISEILIHGKELYKKLKTEQA